MDPVEARTPTQQQVLDPSDALIGGVAIPESPSPPDEASNREDTASFHQPLLPTNLSPPNRSSAAPKESSPSPQTTTPTPSTHREIQPPEQLPPNTEPDILKTNPSKPNKFNKSHTSSNIPPFIVTRTASSTSVSASARVHIQTPISRFSLRQGADHTHAALPAPHLRPSLLKLAAQAMTARRSRQTRSANDDYSQFRRPMLLLPLSVLTKILYKRLLDPTYAQFRSPFFEPRFRTALKHAQGQTQRQKFRDNKTPTATTIDTNPQCKGKTQAILYAEPKTNCEQFNLCIPHQSQGETIQFVCADKGLVFDPESGRCKASEHVHCSETNLEISVRDAELISVFVRGLCPVFKKGTFLIDALSECRQYLQCPTDHRTPISVEQCPDGQLFSQVQQKCTVSDRNECTKEIFSLLKLASLKTHGVIEGVPFANAKYSKSTSSSTSNHISEGSVNVRQRRSLTFEDRNPHREASSGALTNVAGIFNDHSSVVEAQSPGNVVEGKSALPKFHVKPGSSQSPKDPNPVNHLEIIFYKDNANVPLQPETSLELNKTTLNGATIEVSEIASPDNKGKVTITSVVPKLVRLNGNGETAKDPSKHSSLSISNTSTEEELESTPLKSDGSHSSLTSMEETMFESHLTTEGVHDAPTTVIPDEVPKISEDRLSEAEVITERNLSIEERETTAMPDTLERATEIVFSGSEENLDSHFLTTEHTNLNVEKSEMLTSTVGKDIPETVPPTTVPTVRTSTSTTTTTTSTTTTPPPTTTSSTTIKTTTPASTSSSTVETTSAIDDRNVNTNFTCRDKELDQFYPDIEQNCRVFHYCSPGFTQDEVLDLTFVCSQGTRFDIKSTKCQDLSTIVCGEQKPETTTPTTSTTTTTTEPSTTTTTTTEPTTTTTTTTEPTTTTTTKSTTTTTELVNTTPTTSISSTTASTSTASTTTTTATTTTISSTSAPTSPVTTLPSSSASPSLDESSSNESHHSSPAALSSRTDSPHPDESSHLSVSDSRSASPDTHSSDTQNAHSSSNTDVTTATQASPKGAAISLSDSEEEGPLLTTLSSDNEESSLATSAAPPVDDLSASVTTLSSSQSDEVPSVKTVSSLNEDKPVAVVNPSDYFQAVTNTPSSDDEAVVTTSEPTSDDFSVMTSSSKDESLSLKHASSPVDQFPAYAPSSSDESQDVVSASSSSEDASAVVSSSDDESHTTVAAVPSASTSSSTTVPSSVVDVSISSSTTEISTSFTNITSSTTTLSEHEASTTTSATTTTSAPTSLSPASISGEVRTASASSAVPNEPAPREAAMEAKAIINNGETNADSQITLAEGTEIAAAESVIHESESKVEGNVFPNQQMAAASLKTEAMHEQNKETEILTPERIIQTTGVHEATESEGRSLRTPRISLCELEAALLSEKDPKVKAQAEKLVKKVESELLEELASESKLSKIETPTERERSSESQNSKDFTSVSTPELIQSKDDSIVGSDVTEGLVSP